MKLSIYEILKLCNDAKADERPAVLRKHDNPVLRTILQYAYSPHVKWVLPEGAPPYKPCDLPDQENRLYQEARRLYLFIEGGNDKLHPVRRETLFIQLLESIDPNDATLLIAAKDKKLPFRGVTSKVVVQAFPGLLD